jgi:hypothetical protein
MGIGNDPADGTGSCSKWRSSGGKQILLEDPDGNQIELFEPAS